LPGLDPRCWRTPKPTWSPWMPRPG